ncbi:MAG: UDP-3-O-(3-hydroxymyristoyl)glucosamine N-acyltransferase [marine benthic group bacterium]|jgi:UDP-3-O-[3-hydroxymyristoyl] glucosamine N-acyltransferase|nr:UDP-3-O-(3-hydroxymyristoyl)glucosamine N-acyltransferase [Gemmatimonadota bacterium]MCL7961759.1 UDP-3-O-(3-hydroxymyristoyl)glucosamine N-acyltransferase [Candidatus Carthagonibacter metallireducens]MCL7936775.1 UDP-3-O-(3-hydroxymyristoyl)glucosamine N-acyltransferase [Gemmatimonadota bacterium]MCL7957172.1 UDP-3-O-(3-hydroxymyristoyl)glucosamine N-acyltransferase [Gemmatimonadota bacterium]MCL7964426.1 UDP-3-O-(3-hydroxymyristoyl)glucosamine N-acyltransferase [Gemmatimonadota bacterium]
MTFTARELAERVSGRVEGDPDRLLAGIAPAGNAGPEHLTYVVNEKYARRLQQNEAGAALVPVDLDLDANGTTLIRVENPELAFSRLIALFLPAESAPPGVHPTAVLGEGTVLGVDVSLGPYVTVGRDCRIGDRCEIGPGVHIGQGVSIGDDCVIGANCSLLQGAVLRDRVRLHTGVRLSVDGFGYAAGADGPVKIPQVGRCVIGNDVEIGANSTIDRGSLGDTSVGDGTKIDNLVHIGHNCRIGRNCFIVAQVGIAGSSIVEDGARLAGQVGLAGHLTVGAGASVGAQSGVMTDIPAGEIWSGYPARPHRMWLRATSYFYKLPELARRIEALGRSAGEDSR